MFHFNNHLNNEVSFNFFILFFILFFLLQPIKKKLELTTIYEATWSMGSH